MVQTFSLLERYPKKICGPTFQKQLSYFMETSNKLFDIFCQNTPPIFQPSYPVFASIKCLSSYGMCIWVRVFVLVLRISLSQSEVIAIGWCQWFVPAKAWYLKYYLPEWPLLVNLNGTKATKIPWNFVSRKLAVWLVQWSNVLFSCW